MAGRSEPDKIKITPKMIKAGVAAYEVWCLFADAPLEGKSRTWLTQKENDRLTEEMMVCEIVNALFGNASGGRFDVRISGR